MIRKTKSLGILLLLAFIGFMVMPLLSPPAKPFEDNHELVYFENGDDHASHWLIRSISESEELNVRSEISNNVFLFFDCWINYHSNILKVSISQTNRWNDKRLSKERLYLINSMFTI